MELSSTNLSFACCFYQGSVLKHFIISPFDSSHLVNYYTVLVIVYDGLANMAEVIHSIPFRTR